MKEKSSIKRLGYGFSALVMSLSAVTFVPSFSNAAYAESECVATAHLENSIQSALNEDNAVVCLDGTLELTSKLNITKNVTLDLNGNKIVQTSLDTIFKVTGELTIIDSVGGGSIAAHDGKGITGTGSTGTINVKSGTFNGKFNKADAGTLNVTGGAFDYGVAPAGGYYTYVLDEEAGTYYVTTKLNVYPAVTSDTVSVNKARNIATYSIVKDYEGEEMKPEIAVTLDGAEAAEEDYELSYGVYNTERNVVAATLNKTGRYVFTIKDAAGVAKRVTLNAYEVAEDNIDGNVYSLAFGGEVKDVTADLGVDPISSIEKVESDKTAVATAEVADGKLLVKSDKPGTANITVTLSGKAAEKLTFTVNVYRTNASSYLLKAGETATMSLNASPWAINPELSDDGVLESAKVTAPETLNGNSSLTLKAAKAGTITLTLKSDEDGAVKKDVKVSVYEAAEEIAVAKGTTISALSEDIIKLPEGYTEANVTIVEDNAAETSAALNGAGADRIFTAVSAGSKTYTYKVKKGALESTATVTVYVYGEAAEVEDQTVALGGDLDIAALYTAKANSASTVTYVAEGDGAAITEEGVFSSEKVGEKTVTITETLAGKTIAEQTVKVTVTGIEVPEVKFFAGETETWTIAAEGATIDADDVTTNTNLTVTVVDGGFEFAATKAGTYTVVYGLVESDATVSQTVTVYNKLATTDEDLTIDLVEDSTDTDASFKVTGDGDITVTPAEGLTADADNGTDGVYKFTATEEGEYEIAISQEIDGLTAEKTLTVKVTDSTKTEDTDPTEPEKPGEDKPGEDKPEDKPGEDKPTEEEKVTDIKVSIDKATIKASETAKITVAPEGKADAELKPTYTVAQGSYGIEVSEDGVVSVVKGYESTYDNVATIKVTAAGFTKEVKVTIKANFYWENDAYEVIQGNGQTYVAGSNKSLTVVFDAPFSKFNTEVVSVYNKTLMEKHENGEKLTDEEIDAAWGYWLEPGVDFTVKEGSTIVTLTDTFMAKLLDGEHVLTVGFYDDSNVDEITRKFASATFTVAGVNAPDTGAYTGEGTSATANIATAFVAAMSAIVLAGAATIRKMFRK